MKKILVPFDFSKPAINAYRFAVDVAQQSNGEIHLLHVIELPIVEDGIIAPVLAYEEKLLEDLQKSVEKNFKKFFAKYAQDKVKCVQKTQIGGISKTILDYIEREGIDLVLMGSHGATGFRELFIGSNAEKIVRRSTVPVLVLKDRYKGQVKNIIFPNTLETEHQEDLVMKVKALQSFFGAKLHILWVNTPSNFTADGPTLARLNQFAKRFMFKDYTINIFNHLNEETGIREFTKMIKGDLIALGTHGRTGVSHLISGSLAEDLVNHTKNLVWTYSLKNEALVEK